ncbi:MAG: DUF4430 domain-containing protein [Bacillota bacterium]|nr:DUF4430 domain-containing protein [Bacillota bacterium]
MRKIAVLFIILTLLCACSAGKAQAGTAEAGKSDAAAQESTDQTVKKTETENTGETKPGKKAPDKTETTKPGKKTGTEVSAKPGGAKTAAPSGAGKETGAQKQTGDEITVSVIKSDGSYIIEDGKVSFEDGDSVLSVLTRLGKEQKIPVVYTGTKKNAYVQGIDGIFEFDEGPESGWVYCVNDDKPGKSCGSYTLKSGDSVVWKYVLKIEDGLK